MSGQVFVTGATGLIGGEIAWRLMRKGYRVWCSVRSRSFAEAAARIERRFAISGQPCDWSKLVAIPGDVTKDLLGWDADTIRHLRTECRHVIHCAADTSFASSNRCTEVNQAGTRNILKLCALLGPRVRLFHTSSAVTCLQSETGVIHEDDAPAGFSNDYVHSKRNCEQLVLQSEVDAVVLRPSIVLSADLDSAEFARSILWILPVMRRLGVVPLTGEEAIDAVSVAFVAECLVELLDSTLLHRVYHLAAGPECSITLKQLRATLVDGGHDYSRLRFDSAINWTDFGNNEPTLRRLKGFLNYYLPFLRAGVSYDNGRLKQALGQRLPACARLTEYCGTMLKSFTTNEALQEALRP